MKKIEEYTPIELATLATIIAVIVANKLDINGQNVVGNFIEAVGQSILLIAAQAQSIETQEQNQGENNEKGKNNDNNKELQKQIDELKRNIKNLEDTKNFKKTHLRKGAFFYGLTLHETLGNIYV